MVANHNIRWLQDIVRSCSASALAYKAAFMLTRSPRSEDGLIERCADRYGMLERLLGLLVEQGVPAMQLREIMDRVDQDPARYSSFETAVDEAYRYDAEIVQLIERLLAKASLPTPVDELLAFHYLRLKLHGTGTPKGTHAAEEIALPPYPAVAPEPVAAGC